MSLQGTITEHVTLLTQDKTRVEKFLEHLELAKILSDDVRITTFIEHTIEEETEHLGKVEKLLAQAQTLLDTSDHERASLSVVPTSSREIDSFGHLRRRDDNALTVGSLYGLRQ